MIFDSPSTLQINSSLYHQKINIGILMVVCFFFYLIFNYFVELIDLQIKKIAVFDERIIFLAENLENLRNEHIAQIQMISYNFDRFFDGEIDIKPQNQSIEFPTQADSIIFEKGLASGLIDYSIDATFDCQNSFDYLQPREVIAE